jgi:hypothetical protein
MLWQHALSNLPDTATIEQIAGRLGPALRDSTAAAIYRILNTLDPGALDRFVLLDGRAPIPELRVEACACFAAGMHRVLLQASVPQHAAHAIVSAAARRALFPDTMPVASVDRYVAVSGPVREFSHKAAQLLGVPNEAASILSAVSPYCEAMRHELAVVASDVSRFTAVA